MSISIPGVIGGVLVALFIRIWWYQTHRQPGEDTRSWWRRHRDTKRELDEDATRRIKQWNRPKN